MADEKFCEACKRTHALKEFYASNNLEKYPDGKLNICKKMITMNVDNWVPETFLPILQECDVPYIPKIWNNKLATYGKDRSKVSGVTIIGRYLSTMKIKPNDKWRWADTQYIQELADKETEEAMKRQGYAASEIDQVIRDNRKTIPEEGKVFEIDLSNHDEENNAGYYYGGQDYFDRDGSSADDELTQDLTDEDKKYLRIKWGKTYKPEEWVRLEQLYSEMKESYDIQSAGHEDVLKLVCKTSLKANQLLDIGDVDGAQKMVKMYDSMMKSGGFTAIQNKSENGEFVNSIAEFVVLCEQEGFIERYYTEVPKDRVDETILDLKGYTRSLVTEEMNLGNLIENAVKQMTEQESKEEDEDVDDDDISLEEIDELKYEDYNEYNEFIEDEEMSDEEVMRLIKEGEI